MDTGGDPTLGTLPGAPKELAGGWLVGEEDDGKKDEKDGSGKDNDGKDGSGKEKDGSEKMDKSEDKDDEELGLSFGV